MSAEIFDAIRAGDVSRVEALLAADPTLAASRDERGHSAVLLAQYHRRRELVERLLEAGPPLDVFDASAVGRTDRVAELLDEDPEMVTAYAGDGFYPLGLAAYFGHEGTVGLLLARGADITQVARNSMRVQALHAAVSAHHVEVAELLLEAGAPTNVGQQDGWRPLHGAVHNGDEAMVRLLLAHHADPKEQNDAGKSPIGLAADEGRLEILKLLKGGVS